MEIDFKYYFEREESWVCAAYFKYGKWRIYDNGGEYSIKNAKEANELIDEVMGEMNVSRERVKLVKPQYAVFEEVNFK